MVSWSVIDSDSIFRFDCRSFKDFLFSPSFWHSLSDLSVVQDQNFHVLAVWCFNIVLYPDSSDIPAPDKPTIFPFFRADHLVMLSARRLWWTWWGLLICKKSLFWLEVVNLLVKAHEMSAILKWPPSWRYVLSLFTVIYLWSWLARKGSDALRSSEFSSHMSLSSLYKSTPSFPETSVWGSRIFSRS